MVTSKDVAKAANVSHMTVSRAFQPGSSIKPETRERVLAIAQKLNYIPNYNAKSLVMNRNFSVGLFFSSMEGTSEVFLGDLVSQIYQLLPQNYLLSVNSVEQLSGTTDKNYVIQSILGRFDGIIVATQSEKDDPFIESLQELKIPVVVMNRYVEKKEVYNVSTNESQGIRELVDYLVAQKIKTAGTIKGYPGFYSTQKRHREFVEDCQRAGIAIVNTAVEDGMYNIPSGYQAMKEIIQRNEILPNVIFCGNDDMAIGAIKACHDLNIRVPQDLSIVGFDDTSYAQYISPGLTTVHKPYKEMAKKAMEILLQLMKGKSLNEYKYKIDSQLVIRESVKKQK
ncbi:LacI family DNA-binding transcriptional regulator [Enterococcus sp. 2201sp1_2201st1_B8_2201SCRN_220225]|uniref:LacI family DNA-binding transcriptional regulator n=1 Tax=unclassified Enterococcus TaxID=2608891 RepID=UPI0034A593AA